jgi:XapX domain-containing protein
MIILKAITVGFILGFLVRLLKLPCPAPNTLAGGLAVLAMTVGYILGVRFLGVR